MSKNSTIKIENLPLEPGKKMYVFFNLYKDYFIGRCFSRKFNNYVVYVHFFSKLKDNKIYFSKPIKLTNF